MKYRTILHGTCAMGGKHTPGSDAEKECPILRKQARVTVKSGGLCLPTGAEKLAPIAAGIPGTSSTVFRHGRTAKSGRPRVPAEIQKQKARERTRRWRDG